jgi:RimJ/RimL family protein N-acetyltransferase
MVELAPEQYALAAPIFARLTDFNISLAAVLAGTAEGKVWVDDLIHPRQGFASTSEGNYLVGDPFYTSGYAGLRAVIPPDVYLITDTDDWDGVLSQVWSNRFPRRHIRCHLVLDQLRFADWREHIPEGMQVVRIDQDFLERSDLKNHSKIMSWMADWRSPADFLEHGFAHYILAGNTIASWSLSDCVVNDCCEIGIVTAREYRKLGLASIVVAANVEHALGRGFNHIGWHCLASNAGSLAVGHKVGFVDERQYHAYAPHLAVENPGDLTEEECIDWANHFEGAAQVEPRYAFDAAMAWSLANQPQFALRSLHILHQSGWRGQREWFEYNWRFDAMRGMPEFDEMVDKLVNQDS